MIPATSAALVLCALLASASVSFAQSRNGTEAATPGNPGVAVSSTGATGSSSAGFASDASRVDLSSSVPQEVATDQTQGNAQNQTPPSGNSQAPSLEDLGLSSSQTQSDPQLQARLDKRAHMLKIHQRLGLIRRFP